MQWTLSLREGARRQPCRGPCAAFRAPQADRRRDRLNRRRHNRRSVGVVDSDERVSYGGMAGSGLSGTARAGSLRGPGTAGVRLAVCAARQSGAGIDGPRGGCIRLHGCSSLKQHALLEQMTVEGAPCRKASCVVVVEASRVPGEREEEGLLMRRGCGPDAAAPRSPSRSAKALSRADEAGAILPSKCHAGRSNRIHLRMPSRNRRKWTSQARRSGPNRTGRRSAKM